MTPMIEAFGARGALAVTAAAMLVFQLPGSAAYAPAAAQKTSQARPPATQPFDARAFGGRRPHDDPLDRERGLLRQ